MNFQRFFYFFIFFIFFILFYYFILFYFFIERSNPAHPQINDVVYVDKHVQPSGNPCLGELIKNNYGSLNAETVIRNVTAIGQTGKKKKKKNSFIFYFIFFLFFFFFLLIGDMHAAVYDFHQNLVYVSNASPWLNNTCVPAYDRPFVRLNMTQLFNLPN